TGTAGSSTSAGRGRNADEPIVWSASANRFRGARYRQGDAPLDRSLRDRPVVYRREIAAPCLLVPRAALRRYPSDDRAGELRRSAARTNPAARRYAEHVSRFPCSRARGPAALVELAGGLS